MAEDKVPEIVKENVLPMEAKEQVPDVTATPKPARKRAKSTAAEEAPIADASRTLLYGKYSTAEIVVGDRSLQAYITFSRQEYPNIFGRRKYHAYYMSHLDIVERLVNKLMRGGTGRKVGGKVIRTKGRLQGKKLKVTHIVEDAFDSVSKKTNKNPVQVFVDALQNSAPIEDTTRVRYGGISYNVAVGISSNRRLDVALRNIALAALINAFNKRKRLSETLAEEIMLAASRAPESYAIKKRLEAERIARRAR